MISNIYNEIIVWIASSLPSSSLLSFCFFPKNSLFSIKRESFFSLPFQAENERPLRPRASHSKSPVVTGVAMRRQSARQKTIKNQRSSSHSANRTKPRFAKISKTVRVRERERAVHGQSVCGSGARRIHA